MKKTRSNKKKKQFKSFKKIKSLLKKKLFSRHSKKEKSIKRKLNESRRLFRNDGMDKSSEKKDVLTDLLFTENKDVLTNLLFTAVNDGNSEMVVKLVNAGADVNVNMKNGPFDYTPLMFASIYT